MSFTTIPASIIAVGKAIKAELFSFYIKDSLDDHESRLNLLEINASKVTPLKFDVSNSASFTAATGLYHYEADQAFTITDAFLRIYEKNALTGAIEVDVKRSSTDLNDTSFTSIFTTKPKITYAGAADYDASTNQVFDPGQIVIAKGDFLRLDITQMPTNGVLGNFLVTLYGE